MLEKRGEQSCMLRFIIPEKPTIYCLPRCKIGNLLPPKAKPASGCNLLFLSYFYIQTWRIRGVLFTGMLNAECFVDDHLQTKTNRCQERIVP